MTVLQECRAFGGRGVLVHGRSLAESGALAAILANRPPGLEVLPWRHAGGEPTLEQLDALLAAARRYDAEWFAGIGGGSVMDSAKAAAGLLHAPLAPKAYHDGAPIPESRVPFIAVPTTAGTGSEATSVSVLTNPENGSKKSIRHPSHMARLILLDPALLAHCPPRVIAHSGMDAFVQAVESFISIHASAFTDALCLRAVGLIAASIEAVFRGEGGEKARDLLEGSYLAGLALSNARLGIVHGLAHPLGTRYHQPHGLVCAVCLPHALEFNRGVIGPKYAQMSAAIGADLLDAACRLLSALCIESPFAGQPPADREWLVRETLASGSTAANPREVTAPDVEDLLARIFRGRDG